MLTLMHRGREAAPMMKEAFFHVNQEGFFTTKDTKSTKIAWVGLVVIEAHHGKALCAVRFSRRGVALDWMVARAAPP